MAVAEKKVERRVIEDVTVVLRLSEDEAATLNAVLSLTAGNRRNSPREHVVSILDALRRAGVFHPNQPGQVLTWREAGAVANQPVHPSHLAEGMVRFRDYPAEA